MIIILLVFLKLLSREEPIAHSYNLRLGIACRKVLFRDRQKCRTRRRRLFPFRKRSLPLLTVDAIIGNQAFCHGRCNICSGLSHNKVTNTFYIILEGTKFKPKLNLH